MNKGHHPLAFKFSASGAQLWELGLRGVKSMIKKVTLLVRSASGSSGALEKFATQVGARFGGHQTSIKACEVTKPGGEGGRGDNSPQPGRPKAPRGKDLIEWQRC